jgi:hypothetical protein
MGITVHVPILAGAAIDQIRSYASYPFLPPDEWENGWGASVRDARDTRETQHIAPAAYQAGSSCRQTTPLRRTASGTVTCIRGMWGRTPAIQPARRKHRRSTEDSWQRGKSGATPRMTSVLPLRITRGRPTPSLGSGHSRSPADRQGRPLRTQWDAFRAQRTGAGLPDPTWKRCERFEGNTVCCCEFASYEAVHGECSDSNRLSAALPQRGKCAADGRTGVDDVVDDRDALASELGLKGLGDRV